MQLNVTVLTSVRGDGNKSWGSFCNICDSAWYSTKYFCWALTIMSYIQKAWHFWCLHVPSGGCHTDIKYVSVMAAKDLQVEVESLSLFLWIPCSLLLGIGYYTYPQMDVHVEPMSGVSDALNVPQAIKSGQHTVWRYGLS